MFGLDFIKKLKPCIWKFKPGPLADGRNHIGFIAQDINKIVDYDEYSFVGRSNGYYNLNYQEFIGPIVKAIQDLDTKIEELNERLERMENDKHETNSNNR